MRIAPEIIDKRNTNKRNKMKTTQYAVKYELSNHHTGRLHASIDEALQDLSHCQRSAKAGTGDHQGIILVAVDGDTMRPLTEAEMDSLAAACMEHEIEA